MESNFFEIELAGQRVRVRGGTAHPLHRYIWNSPTRHCHKEYELHILRAGTAMVEVGKQTYQMDAGQGMLIAPGKYHRASSERKAVERFSLQVAVSDGSLAELLQREVPECVVFQVPQHLIDLCGEYYYETAAVNPYRREVQHALLTYLLVSLLRMMGDQPVPEEPVTAMSVLARREIIDDFFGDRFAEAAGQEALAQKLHLSQRQLARVLEKDYGMNYREKLIHARMEQAAWLLRTTKQPIPQIAAFVGYKSESAFYKVFYSEYQQTPRQYRLENRIE